MSHCIQELYTYYMFSEMRYDMKQGKTNNICALRFGIGIIHIEAYVIFCSNLLFFSVIFVKMKIIFARETFIVDCNNGFVLDALDCMEFWPYPHLLNQNNIQGRVEKICCRTVIGFDDNWKFHHQVIWIMFFMGLWVQWPDFCIVYHFTSNRLLYEI